MNSNCEMPRCPALSVRVILLCGLAFLAGCAPVAPWERGHLAKPEMNLDPHPMQSALRSHVHSSREAASGGSASEGGGCGCY